MAPWRENIIFRFLGVWHANQGRTKYGINSGCLHTSTGKDQVITWFDWHFLLSWFFLRLPFWVFNLVGSLTLFLLLSFCIDRLYGFSIYLFIIFIYLFIYFSIYIRMEKEVLLWSSLMQSIVWWHQNWWAYWSHAHPSWLRSRLLWRRNFSWHMGLCRPGKLLPMIRHGLVALFQD